MKVLWKRWFIHIEYRFIKNFFTFFKLFLFLFISGCFCFKLIFKMKFAVKIRKEKEEDNKHLNQRVK